MAVATFNLDRFRSRVFKDSLARTNRFEVLINMPPGLTGSTRTAGELVSLYCEQASLPSQSITAKAFKTFGPSHQRPISTEYGGEGIALSFHVDRDMKVRKFFENWMNIIVDPNSFTVNYQRDYITTIAIRQLDEQENVTHEIELLEAFPRSMNIMELNNASTNQTHRLNIIFAFRYWKNKDRNSQATPIDISPNILFPQVPRIDTRPAASRNVSSGDNGNPMGDLSNYGNNW